MRPGRLIPALATVRQLVDRQFPQWAALPLTEIARNGWDNTTFRLGTDLKVRLPSAGRYVAQVEKEHRWLPILAGQLPLPIPAPVAIGEPSRQFPWPWSVYRWLDGDTAADAVIDGPVEFARDVAAFLRALQRIPCAAASEAVAAGPHSFYRGGSLAIYDAETRHCAAALSESDRLEVLAVWDAALAASWQRPDVWVHGDVAASNLLTRGGRLSAVIDFGCCAVGDPACDLVIAWTFFRDDARAAFRSSMNADAGQWARARGWALWKALLTARPGTPLPEYQAARRVVDDVLEEHRAVMTQP